MTNIKFEGVLEGIRPRQLEYIASVLEKHGYNEVTAVIDEVGKAGDNYMASVKRITVEKDGKTFKMVAKVAPELDKIRLAMNTAIAFRNEHMMYTEILPKLTELEEAADVPENERLRYAVCYGSFTEEPNEIILLEDLREAKFTMLDRFKPLTDPEVKLILKSFARLHGSSYALKYKYPTEFTSYQRKLVNYWDAVRNNEQSKYYFQALDNDLQKIFVEDKYKRLTKGIISSTANNMLKLKVDENTKHTTIMHGDPWTNNFMFRCQDNLPVETCMIDYQISKYSVPASDLHYMIFNCTDYETRTEHFNDWIDYYHSQLDDCLSNFSLKASFVYPKDQLDADMKRHAKVSLGQAALLARTTTKEAAEAEKFKEAMENGFEEVENIDDSSQLDPNTSALYRTRVEDVVDSFIQLGYISI